MEQSMIQRRTSLNEKKQKSKLNDDLTIQINHGINTLKNKITIHQKNLTKVMDDKANIKKNKRNDM